MDNHSSSEPVSRENVNTQQGKFDARTLEDVKRMRPNKKYASFIEAHSFARSLHLKTRKEWRSYVKGGVPDKPQKPDNIPAHPDGIYKVKGWQGWKYWLGTADRGLFQ